jgi:hypothetical protein
MTAWENPWTWPPYRRMRRRQRAASVLAVAGILAAIPAGWIVLVPTDPTLRPDLTTGWAWTVLGLCVVLVLWSQRIVRRGRAAFDRAIYEVTQATRDAAAHRQTPLEITLAECYPPVLLSRQYRLIGIAGARPLFRSMDDTEVAVESGETRFADAPRQPHVVLRFKDGDPGHVCIAPRDAAGNLERARGLAGDLKDYLLRPAAWEAPDARRIDVAAFIESMRG